MNAAELATAYLDSLTCFDGSRAATLVSNDVVLTIPFSLTGALAPMLQFHGKQGVMDYVESIADNFADMRLEDIEVFAVEGGRDAFVQTIGHLTQRSTGASYDNHYVIKFHAENGLITAISEFTNPVAFGKLMGLPLG
jgi:ketosteroid isomerase-like protein